ncbi:methyltransferase family protein [Parvicella tangerina]|uniref:methyltransferase family protein n=1 Tax=Parvicella tangerina TaxID=2829795 RepID=UPI00215C0376|nr:isoprenylcysteine carboxylmethyltransferase family protein [Parvicella tangerina]
MSKTEQKYSLLRAILLEFMLIILGLFVYSLFPFFQFYFSGPTDYGIRPASFWVENGLYYLAIVYAMIVPILFYSYRKEGRSPKSTLVFDRLVTGEFDKVFWFCIRTFLLKFLFIPLMFLGALYFGDLSIAHLFALGSKQTVDWNLVEWINNYIFGVFMYVAMTLVLVVYAFGYCVESDLLNNRIKSVDNTFFGWIVTIICYAPIYPLVFYIIPMGAQDFAFFKNHEITAVVRIILMLIVAFKTWSIIVLGTKSSNLTNRGIVEHGPYRWIRHPHYLSKMMVWWIGVLPSLVNNYWLIGGMIFWTTIYILRGLTEEQHLKKDPVYQLYMKKVRWRFFPGIF